jgi:hypothetical protein
MPGPLAENFAKSRTTTIYSVGRVRFTPLADSLISPTERRSSIKSMLIRERVDRRTLNVISGRIPSPFLVRMIGNTNPI